MTTAEAVPQGHAAKDTALVRRPRSLHGQQQMGPWWLPVQVVEATCRLHVGTAKDKKVGAEPLPPRQQNLTRSRSLRALWDKDRRTIQTLRARSL